jgi:ATP-binding cassette subfamily B protein
MYFTSMPSPIATARALRFLLTYIKKYRLTIGTGIALLMVVDTIQLIIPRIIKKILDTLGEQGFSRDTVLKNALIIVALAAAMVVLRFFWRLCIFLPSRKIETNMRDDLFNHLTGLSFSFFNSVKTGDLMALLINDLNAVRMATGPALIGLTDAIFMGGLSLAFMLSINVKLTLVTVTPLPLILVVMIKFGAMIQSKFKNVQESFGALSSHTQEAFSGIRVVKGFTQEESELEKFTARCDEYVDKNLQLVRSWGVFFPLIGFFASISIALLFLYGGGQVITNRISLGDFVSFSFYIQMFVWPIMATGWVFNIFQRGIASVKRLLELLDARSDVHVSVDRIEAYPPIRGEIVMKDLSFSYTAGGKETLCRISCTVPAGSALGIIGKPGAGKTTLVNLLFHLFPIPRGNLFIDGNDINDLPLDILRKSIAYVPQDSFLFSDTIENNIAFGMPDGRSGLSEAISSAARSAAIDKDVTGFPKTYATMVGERGITLSGGQKQRIAIARALMLKAPVLILDDALSSVDAGTEREILTAIRREARGRTTFIIAHRISTVMDCDTIIVLENGEITERGTHKRLLERNGFYARLYALQKLKEKEAR